MRTTSIYSHPSPHPLAQGFLALKDFMLLLLLFIFIFAILGLQQFGGSPAFEPGPNMLGYTPSFDTLWQSGYTVFQLLTGARRALAHRPQRGCTASRRAPHTHTRAAPARVFPLVVVDFMPIAALAAVLTPGNPPPSPPPADSWVSVSWDGMLARGTAACLYFVAWIVIGNFVLLTLFLAILITNFQVRHGEACETAQTIALCASDDRCEGTSLVRVRQRQPPLPLAPCTRMQSDEDTAPTAEELAANPYAPDDQSETASTVFASTAGGEDGPGGWGTPGLGRAAGRQQPCTVVRHTLPHGAALHAAAKPLVVYGCKRLATARACRGHVKLLRTPLSWRRRVPSSQATLTPYPQSLALRLTSLPAGSAFRFCGATRCFTWLPPSSPAGGGGPGNALTQRIAGRTEAGQVHKVKRWMVLAGYTHGMQHREVRAAVERRKRAALTHRCGLTAVPARCTTSLLIIQTWNPP